MKWVTDGENIFGTQKVIKGLMFSVHKKRSTIGKWVKEVNQSLPNGSNQVTSKSVETHLNIIINKNEKIHNFCTLNCED